MKKGTKEVVREGWNNLKELYQEEIDEVEEKLEALRKEMRHIKAELDKLN